MKNIDFTLFVFVLFMSFTVTIYYAIDFKNAVSFFMGWFLCGIVLSNFLNKKNT